MGEELGRGAFGVVHDGTVYVKSEDKSFRVAIKSLPDSHSPDQRSQFVEEAIILK